jgi:hypothetical protein
VLTSQPPPITVDKNERAVATQQHSAKQSSISAGLSNDEQQSLFCINDNEAQKERTGDEAYIVDVENERRRSGSAPFWRRRGS